MVEIKPLNNYVLIEKKYTEQIGSIYIPEHIRPEATTGIVLAVGNLVKDIKVGDTAHFPKYVGLNFTVKQEKYYMISASDILLCQSVSISKND